MDFYGFTVIDSDAFNDVFGIEKIFRCVVFHHDEVVVGIVCDVVILGFYDEISIAVADAILVVFHDKVALFVLRILVCRFDSLVDWCQDLLALVGVQAQFVVLGDEAKAVVNKGNVAEFEGK